MSRIPAMTKITIKEFRAAYRDLEYVSFDTQESGNNLIRAGVISVDTVRPGESGVRNMRAGGQ
jgi:hypothetical protein